MLDAEFISSYAHGSATESELALISLSVFSPGLCWASPREEINRENDERSDEQHVNQVRGDKATKKPN